MHVMTIGLKKSSRMDCRTLGRQKTQSRGEDPVPDKTSTGEGERGESKEDLTWTRGGKPGNTGMGGASKPSEGEGRENSHENEGTEGWGNPTAEGGERGGTKTLEPS